VRTYAIDGVLSWSSFVDGLALIPRQHSKSQSAVFRVLPTKLKSFTPSVPRVTPGLTNAAEHNDYTSMAVLELAAS